MIDFFSDLDKTLIYSHRFPLHTERIAAEMLNGRIQSYMTAKTFDFFSAYAHTDVIRLIPTTTRTCEQYLRLADCFSSFRCRYALVCNGGILLDNNEIDMQWAAETKEAAKDSLPGLSEAKRLMRCELGEASIHSVDGIMVYGKSERPDILTDKLSKAIADEKLTFFYDARKVYCFPDSINKGAALKRFMELKGLPRAVAAGDGTADISMLEAADTAILQKDLADRVKNPNKVISDGSMYFSDFICETLIKLASSACCR